MSARVLIVDDDDSFRWAVAEALRGEGYEVLEASTAEEGMRRWRQEGPEVVILDLRLPDLDGLAVLERMRDEPSQVIVATAYAEVEQAVRAMKLGAYDYLSKPLRLPELLVTVANALRTGQLERRLEVMQEGERRRFEQSFFLGNSPAMRRVYELVDKVAKSPRTPVLLLGESGTGKELIAKLIHHRTPGLSGPFLEVNCASLSENLLESELFGHERGAFTDAKTTKRGLLELAHGGTLFLDEIGEMSPGVQARLLKVLEGWTFRRLGGLKDIRVSLRLIAATNRDLQEAVREGRFRADLYWRLNVFTIALPPLRERPEDIVPLAEFFLRSFAQALGKPVRGLSEEAKAALLSYAFPGNVRELKNMIERAVILESDELVRPESLGIPATGPAPAQPPQLPPPPPEMPRPRLPTLAELEREYIQRVLAYTGGNKSQASRLLGISYPTLLRKMRRWGMLNGEEGRTSRSSPRSR